MKMSGDIRVKADHRYHTLYKELKNSVVKEMHELFFLCACIGYRKGKTKPLGKTGEDRFWSSTITTKEYACFYAMMLEETNLDFSLIKEDKAVIARMEEYANAGMEIILEDFLSDYLNDYGNDLKLDSTCAKELPKIFLSFIFEQIVE